MMIYTRRAGVVVGLAVVTAAQTVAAAALPLWSDKVPLAAGHVEHFVAPDGKADNVGTQTSPWDLTSMLAGKQKVAPGDVVWLRGGRYGQGKATVFNASLRGTEQKPIFVRQYPGERATIDGGIESTAQWVWFWGFEITNSSEERRCLTKDRPSGLNLNARGCKAVNLAIHDAGHPGIGFWVGVGDTGEVHGCLLYGNGLYDMGDKRFPNGWTRGSPIYAQNKDGTRSITDVIAFRNFTTGMKAYTEGGYANGFHFEGNVTFDSPDWNLFGSGKKNAMERLKLIGNCTYRRPNDAVTESVMFGYYEAQNLDAEVRDNYFVLSHGGERAFLLKHWKDLTVTGNTIVGQGTLATWIPGTPDGKINWDGNTYYGQAGKAFLLGKQALDAAGWKSATGFDGHSSFVNGQPGQNKIVVRANQYEPGRGNVVVYNWEKRAGVSVDLSPILPKGAKYEVRDAQNFFAGALASGTWDGRAVTLPMNLTEIAPVVGQVQHLKYRTHTAPEFAVFVVVPVGEGK